MKKKDNFFYKSEKEYNKCETTLKKRDTYSIVIPYPLYSYILIPFDTLNNLNTLDDVKAVSNSIITNHTKLRSKVSKTDTQEGLQ